MVNINIYEFISKIQCKTITLEDIHYNCGEIEYSEFYNIIQKLISEGILTPIINSSTNGAKLSLYKKYKIHIDKSIKLPKDITLKLHPEIIANKYLFEHPEYYSKYCSELNLLSKWLWNNSHDCECISKKERSFEIFNNEKKLEPKDGNGFVKFIERLGIDYKRLKYYETPEPFADYIPMHNYEITVLICENKDIWYNIRRLMFEDKLFNLFGVNLDGVIYGNGNAITGKRKFLEYCSFLNSEKIHIFYWGDLDAEGLFIYKRFKLENNDMDINLFLKGYEKMVELCEKCEELQLDGSRDLDYEFEDIFEEMQFNLVGFVKKLLIENKKIPQEIINYCVLKENMR